jgi:16S rRNA (guanine527-N7)-methyltransferase
MKLKKINRSGDIKREMGELKKGLDVLHIEYDGEILRKFQRYIENLYAYKNKLHLLSKQDYNRIAKRHFLTSLMSARFVKGHRRCCDIGAGAGFPSLPLKIIFPTIDFVLFESKQKKVKFLKSLICELGTCGVEIINDRAVNYTGRKFDLVLLRAVGKIKQLLKTIDNLIEFDGSAIFYKSHKVEHEIANANREIIRRGFQVQIEKLFTPIEKLPVGLIILKKSA